MSRANPRFRRVQSPAPAPTKNTYMVKIVGKVQNVLLIHTLYYQDEQPIGVTPAPASCASGVNLNVVPALQAAMPTTVTYSSIQVTTLTSPLIPQFTLAIAAAGTLVGTTFGTEVAASLFRYSAIRSKTGRGGNNVPIYVQYVDATGTSLLPAGLTALTTLASAMYANAFVNGGHTFTPSLVSRGIRLARGVLGVLPISNFGVRALLGTVRRRKIGRGP